MDHLKAPLEVMNFEADGYCAVLFYAAKVIKLIKQCDSDM